MNYFIISWLFFACVSLIVRHWTLRKEYEYLLKMKVEALNSEENPLEGTLSKSDYINLINKQIKYVLASIDANPLQDTVLSLINWPKELLHCYDRYLLFKD